MNTGRGRHTLTDNLNGHRDVKCMYVRSSGPETCLGAEKATQSSHRQCEGGKPINSSKISLGRAPPIRNGRDAPVAVHAGHETPTQGTSGVPMSSGACRSRNICDSRKKRSRIRGGRSPRSRASDYERGTSLRAAGSSAADGPTLVVTAHLRRVCGDAILARVVDADI